ncbi:DUF2934 domain-containing protein [Rhizobium sp. LCM 4573]|uniref:DUF2934 domain-containing protein n=1 Tax=Rhizobium sp. LCM 4573 TaxID=1848291 RepID=UPI0008DA1D20|nr:DUF2934 domain-containing protein [Rhizobium sp. LCM 4573]OHV84834.1 hypothetical protein LCM4573_04035 [Rhizobium sp. LCM 4573]
MEAEEDWIRKRAYALWEAEGYPSGKDREHWERAKLEYATLVSAPAKPATVRRKRSEISELTASPEPAVKSVPLKAPAKKRAKKVSLEQ